MSTFKYEEYTGDEYRWRKRICVTIFSQHFPLNAGGDKYLEKRMLEDRYGYRSDVDAGYLQEVFGCIHYPENVDVKLNNRFTKAQIKKYIRDLGQSKKCEEYDCFFFVFLTYLAYENIGTIYREERIHLDDGLCSMQEFYDEINKVEAMRMKPKIFIIQADDIALLHPKQYVKSEKFHEEVTKVVKIPQDADRLVIMSDIPQRFANRNPELDEKNPSFLIKAVGESLFENSSRAPKDREDLLSLTLTINRKVRERIDQLREQGVVRAEDMTLPLTTSTLTKLVNI